MNEPNIFKSQLQFKHLDYILSKDIFQLCINDDGISKPENTNFFKPKDE